MKRCWLLILFAVVVLLMFPVVSSADESIAVGQEVETSESAPISTIEPTLQPTTVIAPPIDLNKQSLDITVSESSKITSGNYSYDQIEFTSTDITIASVDYTGNILGLSEGECKIRAQVKNTSIYEYCYVKVGLMHVKSIDLCCDSRNIEIGQRIGIDSWINPYNITMDEYVTYLWSSSNTSVVIISKNLGRSVVVEGVGAGTSTVSLKADDVLVSIPITVTGKDSPPEETPKPTAPIAAPRSSSKTASATPVPTISEAVSAESSPYPAVVTTDIRSGWAEAAQMIAAMKAGDTGRILMSENSLVPVSLLEALKKTQCALEIDFGEYSCIIDGSSLGKMPDGFISLDIGMVMNRDVTLSAACGGNAYELRFNYHGELPGTFTFRVKADGSRPGETIYLYYFNQEKESFDSLQSIVVDDEGYASFVITHCSSYYITTAMLTGAQHIFESVPNRSRGLTAFIADNAIGFWIGVCVLVIGGASVFVVIFRRKSMRKEKPTPQKEKE